MFSEEFTQEVNSFLGRQAKQLLEKQSAVFHAVYSERTGTLARALSSSAGQTGSLVGGTMSNGSFQVSVPYPQHIRVLDMKKGSTGKRKSKYAPIYNKYVYGYLKSALYKKMVRVVPVYMISTIEGTITSVK